MNKKLFWILFWPFRNHNFYDEYTDIRILQCDTYGHPKRHMLINYGKHEWWCTWCSRGEDK